MGSSDDAELNKLEKLKLDSFPQFNLFPPELRTVILSYSVRVGRLSDLASLSLVSKEFYGVASSFLHEDVRLERGEGIVKRWLHLMNSKKTRIGRHVKKLTLCLDCAFRELEEDFTERPEMHKVIAGALRSLVNLKLLQLTTQGDLLSSVSMDDVAILHDLPFKLERFWNTVFEIPDILAFLQKQPEIESLWYFSRRFNYSMLDVSMPNNLLPKAKNMSIPLWFLPHVRHCPIEKLVLMYYDYVYQDPQFNILSELSSTLCNLYLLMRPQHMSTSATIATVSHLVPSLRSLKILGSDLNQDFNPIPEVPADSSVQEIVESVSNFACLEELSFRPAKDPRVVEDDLVMNSFFKTVRSEKDVLEVANKLAGACSSLRSCSFTASMQSDPMSMDNNYVCPTPTTCFFLVRKQDEDFVIIYRDDGILGSL